MKGHGAIISTWKSQVQKKEEGKEAREGEKKEYGKMGEGGYFQRYLHLKF
jgi:hypothetical protein